MNGDNVCTEEGIRGIRGKVFCETTVRPSEYVEDEHGATKNIIHSTLIAHLLFHRASSRKINRYQKPMKDRKGDYIYKDRTHTESLLVFEFLESHSINPTSHPADWYNVLIPLSTRR